MEKHSFPFRFESEADVMFLEQSPISLFVKSWTNYKNELGFITEEEEESKQFHNEETKK